MISTFPTGVPLGVYRGRHRRHRGRALARPDVPDGPDMGYHLTGMPMDTDMIAGMGLIIAGVAIAG